MENYFESKVRLVAIDEHGREKKVTETYLIDAMSYTEAESRTVECLKDFQTEWNIVSIKKSNINEVIAFVGERWHKAKIAFIDTDQQTGKEKKVFKHILLSAACIDEAFESLQKEIGGYVVPAEIVSISESPVVEVVKYN